MFDWYRNSKVHYVYPADVDSPLQDDSYISAFRSSRWFSRGWTLKEILAPENMVFFSKDWTLLWTKQELCEHISAATGIRRVCLESSEVISTANIARWMSWIRNCVTNQAE